MSGTIVTTFAYGRMQGWGVAVTYTGWPGALERATVTVTAPSRYGVMPLTSGIALGADAGEYDEVVAAITDGGNDRGAMQALAEWMLTVMRGAVDNPRLFWLPLTDGVVSLWRRLVDQADHSAAEWYARYGDHDTRPPFEIVGHLSFHAASGELVAV